jgi:hypothetical protein
MSQSQVIVCERAGTWSAVLQRHLPLATRLRQVRSLRECDAKLRAAADSLVVVELVPARRAAVIAWLVQLARQFPFARAIVVADRGAEAYEPLAREAGAIHFTTSPRDLAGWNVMVRNQSRRHAHPKADFAERIWAELPWSEAAVA